jgi:acyl-CoA thioesterase FadM
MNLWFRLIWMLLMSFCREPVKPFETSVHKMRVWLNDLDFNRHVTNGRYFTMADVGRMDYVLRSGVAKVAFQHQALPIVSEASAKFRKDLRLFQSFEIHSRLVGWDEKWTFMEHRFIAQGRVAGIVIIRGLFMGKRGAVKPTTIAEHLGLSPISPQLPDWVATWSTSCDKLSDTLRMEEANGKADKAAAEDIPLFG